MSETAETSPAPPRRRRLSLPHVEWRPGLRWFAAEFLVVVSGVLVALAVNAWWEGRQEAAAEQNYLTLFSRDLRQMERDLEELRDFEADLIEDGLRAHRILSAPARTPALEREASYIVSSLGARRTMAVVDAAYEDLTSTGRLWLIRDPALRDRIVTFYERAERELAIHNRNNAYYVDDLFVGRLFGQGLFMVRLNPGYGVYARSDSLLGAELAGGNLGEADRIWRLPADGPEWAVVRGQVVNRLSISAGAMDRARRLLEDVRALRAAVDDAREP